MRKPQKVLFNRKKGKCLQGVEVRGEKRTELDRGGIFAFKEGDERKGIGRPMQGPLGLERLREGRLKKA